VKRKKRRRNQRKNSIQKRTSQTSMVMMILRNKGWIGTKWNRRRRQRTSKNAEWTKTG
jgi:hypothetical protein